MTTSKIQTIDASIEGPSTNLIDGKLYLHKIIEKRSLKKNLKPSILRRGALKSNDYIK